MSQEVGRTYLTPQVMQEKMVDCVLHRREGKRLMVAQVWEKFRSIYLDTLWELIEANGCLFNEPKIADMFFEAGSYDRVLRVIPMLSSDERLEIADRFLERNLYDEALEVVKDMGYDERLKVQSRIDATKSNREQLRQLSWFFPRSKFVLNTKSVQNPDIRHSSLDQILTDITHDEMAVHSLIIQGEERFLNALLKERLPGLLMLESLRFLDLSNTGITDAFDEVSSHAHLEGLNLEGCVQVNGRSLMTFIKKWCKNLRTLNLKNTRIIANLSVIPSDVFERIEELHVPECELDDAKLKSLLEQASALRFLDCSRNPFRGDAFINFAGLKELQDVKFSGCTLLVVVTLLEFFKTSGSKLEKIDLSDTNMSSKELDLLFLQRNLTPCLKELDVSGTRIRKRDLTKFKQRYPKVEVRI